MRATVAANLDLRAKAPSVDVVDDPAQVVAALDAGFYRAEDFADFTFTGIRAGGALLGSNEVGEELAVDESAEVVAAEGGVLVDLSVLDCSNMTDGELLAGEAGSVSVVPERNALPRVTNSA